MKINPLKEEKEVEAEEAAETQAESQTQMPYKKQKIPKAMREALWIHCNPVFFHAKCKTTWCPNIISPFNFQAGHNIPESKGGETSLDNMVTLCSRCNLSMGNRYTFDEWCRITKVPKPILSIRRSWFSICCFRGQDVSLPSITQV